MVFGLFSKERALKRTIEKATNKLAQHPDRWAALEKLANDGSEEALVAMLKRFSFTYDKTIEDQQEKRWVVDTMISKGEAVINPLRTTLKSATAIAYSLEILGKVAKPDRVLEVVDELIEVEGPGYSRDPEKKTQLLTWLGEWQGASDEEVAKRVVPYLADFDENVRFAAAEALALRPHESAGEQLAAALTRPDEESKRLKVRIAEVLAEGEMPLGEHKAAVAELCKTELDGFHLKNDKLRKR